MHNPSRLQSDETLRVLGFSLGTATPRISLCAVFGSSVQGFYCSGAEGGTGEPSPADWLQSGHAT